MKNSIALFIIALALTVTSCVDVPEIAPDNTSERVPVFDPNPSANLIVTDVNDTYLFDQENEFEVYLDIDQNGVNDFVIYGLSNQDGNSGFLHAAAMYSNGSNRIGNMPTSINTCNQNITFNSIRSYENNQPIELNQDWGNLGVIFLMTEYDGCESSLSFTNMGQTNYYGLRINIGGHFHYGWLEMELGSLSRLGFPNCSNSWTVKRFAYNSISNEPVRTPQ